MASYWQKLKDPRWQKRRLEILSSSEFRCEACLNGDETLHVHHLKYDKGKDPWEYDDNWLVVLCESCHEEWHEARDMLTAAVAGIPPAAIRQVAGYAFALSGMSPEFWRNGQQRLPADLDVAAGVYDAVRHWIPGVTPETDGFEYHIQKLIDAELQVGRGTIWQAYADFLAKKRELRRA